MRAVHITNSTLPVSGAITLANGSGIFLNGIMQPTIQASANFSNAKECQTDSVGASKIQILMGGMTAATVDALVNAWLVVGFSTVVNDQVAVKALIDSITTTSTGKLFAPDGILIPNCVSLPIARNALWEIDFDTIYAKTVGFQISVAVANLLVSTNVVRQA